MTTREYAGYTLAQLKQLVEDSNLCEESIDDLCGGDQATSSNIIDELVQRLEKVEAFLVLNGYEVS